jgi:ferredoxin
MKTLFDFWEGVFELWSVDTNMWNHHSFGKHKIIHTIEANCTGCKVCIKKCPRCVLGMVSNENGTYVAVQKPNYCNACGDCVRACKFNALELTDKEI